MRSWPARGGGGFAPIAPAQQADRPRDRDDHVTVTSPGIVASGSVADGARQTEEGHDRLVRQVGVQPQARRQCRDRVMRQVRRAGVPQPYPAGFDDADLFLGPGSSRPAARCTASTSIGSTAVATNVTAVTSARADVPANRRRLTATACRTATTVAAA